MLRPVGSQPSSVYWRRRLFVLGSLVLVVVLLVLTVNAVRSDGNGQASANSTGGVPSSAKPRPSSSPPASTSGRESVSSSTRASASTSGRSSSTPVAADCTSGNLTLRARTAQSGYQVGDSPLLQLQVTNTGAKPCVQNLADKLVELRVYNGESRVWGSRDCKTAAGSLVRTLAPQVPVLVTIKWLGLSSEPGCTSRQRVGAGTYTLYASLAGHQAHAATFTIS